MSVIEGIGAGGIMAFGAETASGSTGATIGGGLTFAPVDKQTFGASVVTRTLDFMNQQDGFGSNADYEFQKDVLGAAMLGKGAVTNTKA